MKFNPKIELGLHIVNTIILIMLCTAVTLNGLQLSCDNCIIEFESEGLTGANHKTLSVPVTDIFDYWIETGECYVKWSRTDGWVKLGGGLDGFETGK